MVLFASSSFILNPLAMFAESIMPDIHVVKNVQCGCCDSWVQILFEKGFKVSTENLSNYQLTEFKTKSGVPKDMMSCHTAKIMSYFIEGHVPTEDIKRLITELPNALGLAVPGMPYGSPGMGPEAKREAYDVFIVRKDGTSEVFNHYPKAESLA